MSDADKFDKDGSPNRGLYVRMLDIEEEIEKLEKRVAKLEKKK